jgi:hypothetical protein
MDGEDVSTAECIDDVVFAGRVGFSDKGIERSKDLCDVFQVIRCVDALSLADNRPPCGFTKPESIAKEWGKVGKYIVQYWCLSKPP